LAIPWQTIGMVMTVEKLPKETCFDALLIKKLQLTRKKK